MKNSTGPNGPDKDELAKKNIRLAIILGLVAFGLYAGFVVINVFAQ